MTIDRRNALRLTSLAAAGAGITGGLGGAARAEGRRPARDRANTITLTGKRTAADLPDVLVPGTPYFVHYELRDADGNPVGTESAECTPVTVGPDGALVLASLVLILGDGMITASTAFQRPLPALTEVLVAPASGRTCSRSPGGPAPTTPPPGPSRSSTSPGRTTSSPSLSTEVRQPGPAPGTHPIRRRAPNRR